jgi:hypothetical protein
VCASRSPSLCPGSLLLCPFLHLTLCMQIALRFPQVPNGADGQVPQRGGWHIDGMEHVHAGENHPFTLLIGESRPMSRLANIRCLFCRRCVVGPKHSRVRQPESVFFACCLLRLLIMSQIPRVASEAGGALQIRCGEPIAFGHISMSWCVTSILSGCLLTGGRCWSFGVGAARAWRRRDCAPDACARRW